MCNKLYFDFTHLSLNFYKKKSLGREIYHHQLVRKNTYNQHCDQQVLLSDLGMGEYVVEHIGHVAFVFLTQCKHTFVIVSC